MKTKRVVITGMGVVSPNGIGRDAFCRAALAGKSGVVRVSRFDPSDLPVQIAGEVLGFNELDWVDAKERKHVSRIVPLAIAAASEALAQAGVDPQKLTLDEQRDIGVVIGSGGPSTSPRPTARRCSSTGSRASPIGRWSCSSPRRRPSSGSTPHSCTEALRTDRWRERMGVEPTARRRAPRHWF